MHLPKTIEISGYILTIKYKDKIGSKEEECFGLYDPNTKTINLVKGMSPIRKKEIFFHEFVHFLEDIYRMDFTEEDVSCLALGMVQLINNKKIKWEEE